VETDYVSLLHASMEKFKNYLALKNDCVKTLTVLRAGSTRNGHGHGHGNLNANKCVCAVNVESNGASNFPACTGPKTFRVLMRTIASTLRL